MLLPEVTIYSATALVVVTTFSAVCFRIFRNLYFHPLSKFPGPWYAASFSLSAAIISVYKKEPAWLQGLVKKYGSK
jgi:hypothetical protein